MKSIYLFISILIFQYSYSVELQKIVLSKDEKLEGTFSIKMNGNNSLHLLFIKDSRLKQNLLKSFLINSNKKIIELSTYSSSKKLEVIATSYDEDNCTIKFYDQVSRKLTLLNYNLITGVFGEKIIEKYTNPEIILSSKGKTFFVHYDLSSKKPDKLYVDVIEKNLDIKKVSFNLDEDIRSKLNIAFNNIVDAINQDEFVLNGSIQPVRAYLFNNSIHITKKKDNKTLNVFTLDIDNSKLYYNNFDFHYDNETKDYNTFVFEDKLLSINTKYDDVKIKYYDILENKLLKEQTLSSDLTKIFDNNLIKNFLEQEKKTSLKVTSSINKTIDNNFIVNISRVNVNTYHYNYNWWWLHSFMMQQMQMQQMTRMGTGGFGPRLIDINYFMTPSDKKDIVSLRFKVDENFEILKDNNSPPFYKEINKDEFLKEFEDDKTIKNFTASFTEDELRYIYQNNKTKEIFLDFKKLY